MTKNTDIFQIKSQFDDFDHFVQTIQGWKLTFQQLDRGKFTAELYQINTPEVLISDAHFNRHLIQDGTHPEGMCTFVIMAENSAPFIWRKQEVTEDNSLLVFPKGGELDSTSNAGFHVYTISIAERVIAERLQWQEHTHLADRLQRGGVLEGDPEKVVACRHFLKQLIANVQENPELLNSRLFQQQLRDELTCQVLGILSTGRGQVIALPFHKRMKLIKSLKSYLEENGHEHNTVADLCRELQVNERTLRRSLREWYGVSPHQYLLAIRLNGVRQELRRNDPLNTKVCDIANYWSFWHMGNFASVYQRQFGELPSQTLSRESQALTSLTLNCTVSRP